VTTLRAASATDAGRVRRNNQDQVLLEDSLFAVADGMGGHVAGEVASLTAVEALRAAFASHDAPQSSGDLRDAVQLANEVVFEKSASSDDLRGMGTTLTAVALVDAEGEQRLAVANVGDSRAYVFAQGELTQLTEDHSVPEELARQGQITPEEVENHPQRHVLTRALGISPAVEVDLWEVLPYTGDRLLLCSDGLCRDLTDDQIAAVLRRLADPKDAADELVSRARASGGSDNITVVIIEVTDDDGRARSASSALGDEPATGASRPPAQIIEDKDEHGAPSPAPPPAEPPARRRLTLRVLAFVVVLLAVLTAAAGAVGYYARHTYYVGLATSPAASRPAQIVIYKGRPGGLLWFEPTVAERTVSTTADVLPSRLPDLKAGKIEATLAAARRYVGNLLSESAAVRPPSTTLPPLPGTTVP
jgi:serine/threonine protein phosphatase PrpC